MSTGAIFLDRDGVIIEDRNYVCSPEEVSLVRGASAGLRALRAFGLPLLVVSNQSALARGKMTERDLQSVTLKMNALLASQGARVDGVYYCPHLPEGEVPLYRKDCDCRKPKPGLLEQAANEHALDLKTSFLIGDKTTDLQAGRAVGARPILVRTGQSGEADASEADAVVDDLVRAAMWIEAILKT